MVAGPVLAFRTDDMAMILESAKGRFPRVSRTSFALAGVAVLAGCASSPGKDTTIASHARSTSEQARSHTTVQFPDGSVAQGPVVEGKRHGYWTERLPDGSVQAGPYVRDRRHGRWILKYTDGRVQEGPFVAGKRYGEWTLTSPRGVLFHGPYVDGQQHGLWTVIFPNGTRDHMVFVNGAPR